MRYHIHIIIVFLLCGNVTGFAQTISQDTLPDKSVKLNEVVVSAVKRNVNVTRPNMSVEKLDMKQIKLIPALFGEIDLIKAIQMLPGVQATSEGTSGFSVRGGSYDQNLILFDNATVFNASHLMGFFSTFNNEAVDGLTLYKGDIPAAYGGRLSSLLDVQGNAGANEFGMNAGIGLIASRLMVQGPLIPQHATFLVTARRTYADMFLPLAADESLHDVVLYFYDMNVKMQGRIDNHNILSFTGYLGRDQYGGNETGMNFGNKTGTLRWKHFFHNNLVLQTEMLGSSYDYHMSANTPSLIADWTAGVYSAGNRTDLTYNYGQNSLRAGWNTEYQWFSPGNAYAMIGGSPESYYIDIVKKQAWINSVYASHQHTFFDRLTMAYGLRLTRFDNVGATKEYLLNDDYTLRDSLDIPAGKLYNHYWGLEPRVGATFLINDALSVKASYSRTMQFIHLLSTSTAGSPLEVWVPSNMTIKPESANQFAAGVFTNLFDNLLEVSVETYYKMLQDVMDFKDHPKIMGNTIVETEIRTGTGRNYGLEFMVRKNSGDISGWVSYTYSRSFVNIAEINRGKDYQSPFDRPHTLNVILSYAFSKRLTASVNWVYSSGKPVTFPEARYLFGEDYIPIYTDRNTYRFPDFHRMDASVDWRLGKLNTNKKWRHSLNFSVYNLYGRKNPWIINFRPDENDDQYARMTYLFGVVPSVTYTFNLNTK
ncbi:MAG: TonB-dependent receptor [Prevotellaceae bacterium]|jgi:hypothetical protein|nr:TonB-dependent receptor [Prevotellaceae bacterium]